MTDNKSWMFNYDDIFFCYHTEEGIVFDKTIDFHSLIYIHTGELLVNDGKQVWPVRGGQCVFLRPIFAKRLNTTWNRNVSSTIQKWTGMD